MFMFDPSRTAAAHLPPPFDDDGTGSATPVERVASID